MSLIVVWDCETTCVCVSVIDLFQKKTAKSSVFTRTTKKSSASNKERWNENFSRLDPIFPPKWICSFTDFDLFGDAFENRIF
jgi:hypothetical protein